MLNQQTTDQLRALKLTGMLEAWEQQREQPQTHDLSFDERLALLVERQASLRSRERFWDIRVPKIDSIFDNSLVPRPSWSPGVPPQHRKLVAATHRSPI